MNHCSVARKMIGVVAAPAVRVAVLDRRQRQQRPGALSVIDNNRIGFPNIFADQHFRQHARLIGGVIHAPGAVDRTINGQSVLHARNVVFLPMARGGVDRARSLFQRDVSPSNPRE